MRRILMIMAFAGLVGYGCGGSARSPVDAAAESAPGDAEVGPQDAADAHPDETSSGDETGGQDVTDAGGDPADLHDGETVATDGETVEPEVDTDAPYDADTAEVDVAGDVADGDATQPEPYFKSAELAIRILGPSPTGKGQSVGQYIQVAGLVLGQPDSISWETQTGQTGYASGTPYFLATQISLEEGDNVVTVTAAAGEETASDSIVITYNPAFMFGGGLRVQPGAVFTNTSMDLCLTLDMGLNDNFDDATLMVCECTEDGECVKNLGLMHDNGAMDQCDEYSSDAVFSLKKAGFKGTEPGKVCFRAQAEITAGYLQYIASSPVSCVEVVDHVTPESCTAIQQVLVEAKGLYEQTAAAQDAAAAQQAVVSLLQQKPEVAEVGTSFAGNGVWVRFQDGVLGAFDFHAEGMRGGQDTPQDDPALEQIEAPLPGDPLPKDLIAEAKRSVVLSPGHTEFGSADEAAFINDLLAGTECPVYALDGPYYDDKATLARFRNLSAYGIIAVAAHGDSYFGQMSAEAKKGYEWHHQGSQELIWTGDKVDCSKLVQSTPACSGPGTCPEGSECVIQAASQTTVSGLCVDLKQVDLRRGRAVLGPDTYGILPAFIGRHRGNGLPNSLVYLGSCRSMWNGSLALELIAAGAKAVLGYSGYVTSAFAYEQATKFFSTLIQGPALTGDALSVPAIEDPANPGTKLRMLGAANLNVTDSDLVGASWEKGNLTGWNKEGDGRVIERLGITVPPDGKFMATISTGMGYTPQTGEINQMFCIPPDKVEMCFFWKFFSEEFVEYCGSIFQDTFEATVEGEEGIITAVSASVDDLCPPEQCVGCGSQFEGLSPADVMFDIGDVWMTTWRKSCINIMALAGQGAVTLRFFCTDKGDSIFDTVVLIDAVEFK